MVGEQGELIFAYGTLREGASNHHRLNGMKALGEAWMLGRLYGIDWYPGMILDDSEGIPVRGEVYRIEREMLRSLDEFESNEFERLKTTVHLKEGGEVEAWVYEYRGKVEGKREIVPADWMKQDENLNLSLSFFSLLTFFLVPTTVAGCLATLGMEVTGAAWFKWLMQGLVSALPLLPVLTARVARRRDEHLAEGAEICAAIALVAFGTMLGVRFVPVLFEAFPN